MSSADSPPEEQPRKPSFPLGAVLCLIWAGLGPKFLTESDHFGPGFLQSIIWLVSLPILTIYLAGMSIYKIDSYLENRYLREGVMASIVMWPLTLLLYIVLGVYVLSEML